MCRNRLDYLCKEILWVNNPPEMKVWSKFHTQIYQHLAQNQKYNLVMVPRDHLKSSVITIPWAIQQVLRNFNIRILLANAVWDNSRKFLGAIQRYLAPGAPLSMIYGPLHTHQWNQDEITVNGRTLNLVAPTITTTGVEKFQTSQHYDLIIADDLHGFGNVETPALRQKVKEYFSTLYDLLDKKNGRMVVIGTPWTQDDLYADLEEQGGWHIFKKNAYNNDPARASVLFPEKFTPEILDDLRHRKGPYTFSSQYLLNPISEEAATFKKSQVRFYEEAEVPPMGLFLTIDPAISQRNEADNTAIIVAGMSEDRRIFVRDRVRARLTPDQIVQKTFDLVEKWKISRVGIETYGYQLSLKYAMQLEQRKRGKFFIIEEMKKPKQIEKKETFIMRLQPYFEQGLIFLRRDMTDLVDELLAFPRGRHDDLLDALAYQLDYLNPAGKTAPTTAAKEGTYRHWIENHVRAPTASYYKKFFEDMVDTRSSNI